MYTENLAKFGLWLFRYASGQTDRRHDNRNTS